MKPDYLKDIKLGFDELIGEKIVSKESIRGEFGRTYNRYQLIECESGKRVMVYGGKPFEPKPSLEEMRKVDFFTPQEIAKKVERIERKKRKKKQEKLKKKQREFEELKKELEEVGGID